MLVISRAAEREAAEATDWYNARRSDLGFEFLEELQSQLAAIESDPERFARIQPTMAGREVRQARLTRFPYLVVFERKTDQTWVVLAVAHTSRRPGYWQYRSE